MKKLVAICFTILALSTLAPAPSHASSLSEELNLGGWFWALLGMGEVEKTDAPQKPPADDDDVNSLDGGGCVDPDGQPVTCPKPKP